MHTPKTKRETFRIRSRHALITAAVVTQALVIAAGWYVTFRVVQREFAAVIQERVKQENRELAERVELLFPTDLSDDSISEGVAFQSESWERLQQVIENEAFSTLPAGGFACLIEGDGQLLCHPEIRENPGLRNYSFNGVALKSSIDAEFAEDVAEIAAKGGTTAGIAEFTAGDFHYVATRPLGDTGLQLLIHQPVGALVKVGRQQTAFIAGTAGVMAIVVLAVTGGGLAFLLRRYDSVQEALNTQLRENLLTAKRIQESALPAAWPELPGYDVAAWSRPAEETGGDTFDVVGLNALPEGGAAITGTAPAGSLGLLLADATGHGVGPAIAVTQLQAMARVSWRSQSDLMDVVALISERLAESLPEGRFITAWIGRLHADAGQIEMYSAGQGPFFKVGSGGDVETFAADSFPFGITTELAETHSRRVTLEAGDLFVVVSDGIIEAQNHAKEQLGVDRLRRLLVDHRGEDAHRVAEAIRTLVDGFASNRRDDDQTVLVIKRHIACKLPASN